jgi:hypothetical protein
MLRKQAVFGAADGVSAVIGLVALVGDPHALFRAAVGVALAELVGMTAGAWLSADEGTGFLPALANGASAFLCVIAPAVPFAFMRGWPAVGAALAVILAVGGLISWLRSERGLPAVAKTYGVLAVAAAVCVGAAFI